MSKKPGNIDLIVKPVESNRLAKDIAFLPSPPQRQAKAVFWDKYKDFNPGGSGELVTVNQAEKLTGQPAVKRWWGQVGFKEWFLNPEEQKQRLEYVYELGLDRMESIFLNPDSSDTACVSAFKEIAKQAGKVPSTSEKEFADAEVQKLNDKDKLLEFIKRKAPRVLNNSIEDNPKKDELED